MRCKTGKEPVKNKNQIISIIIVISFYYRIIGPVPRWFTLSYRLTDIVTTWEISAIFSLLRKKASDVHDMHFDFNPHFHKSKNIRKAKFRNFHKHFYKWSFCVFANFYVQFYLCKILGISNFILLINFKNCLRSFAVLKWKQMLLWTHKCSNWILKVELKRGIFVECN